MKKLLFALTILASQCMAMEKALLVTKAEKNFILSVIDIVLATPEMKMNF